MLKIRLLTAVLLLPLVLVLFIFGPTWAAALFFIGCLSSCVAEAVLMLVPAFEKRLGLGEGVGQGMGAGRNLVLVAVAVTVSSLIFVANAYGSQAAARGSIVLGLIALFLCGVFSTRVLDRAAARGFALIVSCVYGALPWLMTWDLYEMSPNGRYLLLLLAVVWAGDTGGYFGGRLLGGRIIKDRKLAPMISPNKTWEGAVVGLLLSVVGAITINAFFIEGLGEWPVIITVGLLGGVAGQTGDLMESVLKRFSGVKDSGRMIPGHGGFLDRVDGILFSAPIVWFILYYFKY